MNIFSENVNFLTADGNRFAHPLHHLGKSMDDLPLIAIDSFRHMYLFPSFKDMYTPGKLKQFLQDLYNGKLHRLVSKTYNHINYIMYSNFQRIPLRPRYSFRES